MKEEKKIHILHVISALNLKYGGPSQSVVQQADYLAEMNDLKISLLSQSGVGKFTVRSANISVSRMVLETGNPISLMLGLSIRSKLLQKVYYPKPDLLHGHGIWHMVTHWTALAARQWDIPLILQPRGMLEPWAIQHKGWKKRLALRLYQQRNLDRAWLLVATAEQEYANLRALGLRQPIAIIPNGVALPTIDAVPDRSSCQDGGARTILFLGRIHPVKGLLNLIDAWAQIRPADWRLRMAGPDEAGHLSEVLARVREAGVSESVEYVGAVDGDDKADLYKSADLFVLPSFTENFGLVVAEALAQGLPVITTHGTPWSDLPVFGCGWWVPIGIDPLANALREGMAMSDAERAAMGGRSLAYVKRYNWSAIAEDMAAVYRWVLGRDVKPACVRLD